MQNYESLIGFIECKNFGIDLSPLIKGKQIEKYLSVCHNIILTDYNRFILLSYGKVVDDFTLFASLDCALSQSHLIEITTHFSHLLSAFFDTKVQITRKEALATILATQSFYLSSVINEAQSNESFEKYLGDSHQSFRYLESTDVSIAEFCDILAQSIVYGMFVAHIDGESFEIDKIPTASFTMLLPEHFTTLREFIARSLPATLPQSIQYALSNIIKTIALIDKPSLATSFQKEISEVSIYLYEDFLKEYDKLRGTDKKKGDGVYYTPEPIVNMIVRSIDELLQTHFGKSFSDESVKVLDFATGTGSFLAKVFESILQNQSAVFTKQTIINKCFKDIYGFEMSFVPYIVAHLKLSSILRTQGFSEFSAHQKFQVYLTNTLDLDSHEDSQKAFTQYSELKNERDKSLQLKHKEDLLVILGNPPYNVKSKNKGTKILQLLDSYKMGLNEQNIQPLDDDYIKFIRFAQWKLLEQNKNHGIMGFITNNSFLFGRTHRKMRESLAKTFDEIYILNLHGHSGDENVFSIQVEVCISLFVKYENSHTDTPFCHTNATFCHTDASSYHTDTSSCHTERSEVSKEKNQICHTEGEARSISNIRNKDISLSVKAQYDKSTVIANERSECGNPKNNDKLATIHYFSTKDNEILLRADKFALLNDIANNGLKTIKWQKLKLDSPYFWFVPKDLSDSEYENFWALASDKALGESKAIFEVFSSGIKSRKDNLLIQFSKDKIKTMLNDMQNLPRESILKKYHFSETKDWTINEQRENFSNPNEEDIITIAYRPFDSHFIFYPLDKISKIIPRGDSRKETMKHFLMGENLGICFTKDCELSVYDNAIISDKPADIHYNGRQTYIAPLYTYPDEFLQGDKTPNFTQEFSEFIAKHKVLKSKSPEQILAFIYGNLYNPTYRAKYIEYLKIGFPRIDFEVTQSKFDKLAELGQNLIDLHLMKTIPQDKSIDLAFRKGANESNPNFTLDKPKYENEKIVLNADLEIVGISQEVWDYTIGGYKVLEKWLKYRANDKNGAITLEQSDFTHILNVAKILKATIAIQTQLAQI